MTPAHDHHPEGNWAGAERRHAVLTEQDYERIAQHVARLSQPHVCTFSPQEIVDVREAARTVIMTKRMAFRMGVAFALALVAAAASGFAWVLWSGTKAALKAQ